MPGCSAETERLLALWLGEGEAGLETGLAALRERHPQSRLVLLTIPGHAAAAHRLADEVWSDGRVRGAAGLLALTRRIAWGQFAAVYDLAPCWRSRLYRLLTRPRPPWHLGLSSDGRR